MLSPVLADEQRRALLPVPLPHRLTVGSGHVDGLYDLGHARVSLGAVRGDLACPFRETIGVRGCGAPLLTDLPAQRLGAFGRGLLLCTGLASAEPSHGGEAATGGSLLRDGTEVGGPISLGLHGQSLGDLGTHPLGGGLGQAEHLSGLLGLGSMRSTLSVEPRGDPLPPLGCSFGPLGLAVEAGEFFGDPPYEAVCNESGSSQSRV
ncbi:hypothetical protein [Propionibacterium freudenreichii]|uniref:hypothetical protein n=1 Tax=Propionibacterium freudenreichii TaxID=1744 RepID=UPI001E3C8AEA|nr:hypothetical protein [Propionibacterium freudenreichii]